MKMNAMKQRSDYCIGIEANLSVVGILLNLSAGIGVSILSEAGPFVTDISLNF